MGTLATTDTTCARATAPLPTPAAKYQAIISHGRQRHAGTEIKGHTTRAAAGNPRWTGSHRATARPRLGHRQRELWYCLIESGMQHIEAVSSSIP